MKHARPGATVWALGLLLAAAPSAAGTPELVTSSALPTRHGLVAVASGFAEATPAPAGKLDPRLLALAGNPAAPPEPVWVEFRDKGEQGPADLARRLAEAEAALDPRNRARRVRAGMQPRVDYLDLPIHAPYLESLAAAGFAPYGASRWFNRAAVRADAAGLARLVALAPVARVSPVERGTRERAIPEPVSAPAGARPLGAAAATVAYGRTQWLLEQMNVPAVHDSGYIGAGVMIVVLDEGFNYHTSHEATSPIAVPPARRRDFVEGDGTVTDTVNEPWYFQHGTWVLGCVGGNKPGSYVGSGFGASFALGRTEDSSDERHVEMVWWGMGAEWADSLGADIISSSLGYREFNGDPSYGASDMDGHTTIVSRAAQIAASRGILVVNSAGNSGSLGATSITAPADVNGDSLIAVGAVDSLGNVASFSSRGPTADGRIKPDLVARGVSVPVPSASGDPTAYTSLSGTSFSTPLVAGLAACLMQARPSWPAVRIVRALRETASLAAAPNHDRGYGIPDGLAALRWVDDTASVPPGPLASGVRLALIGPNPFGAQGAVRLRLELGGPWAGLTPRLAAIDLSGRSVATPAYEPASGTVRWDGRGDDGRTLPPGVYLVTAEAAGRRATARVVLTR